MSRDTMAVNRDATDQEWAAWVAAQLESATQHPEKAKLIHSVLFAQAMFRATYPPRRFLPMVLFQHDSNGKTWPRAWALTTWLWAAKWYYGRKR